ncbi:MAG: ribonuclease toxin HepT-like protein [Desulfurispora sp.]|uniref:ribonuclease toxin HepT-like protein n=1 Tax=Desulfurispora sp. TaxID=3014275 RepID=UPI00404B9982
MSLEKAHAYRSLLGDLEDKMSALDTLAHKIQALGLEIDRTLGKVPEEKLMALAGYLHHFYTGVEDVLARIIKIVDGYLPRSGDWHTEILYLSSRPTPGIRPAILSAELHEILTDYKAFRHLYRHAYARELRWKKMDHLALNIMEVWKAWQKSIGTFTQFLQKILQVLEQNQS